ncbi:hypothetical protein GCM10011612_13310 [Actinomyces gaoshouyii]|uniref:Uncharacterized protein n=1 Tax=Actinomyces gaoshouyii TaxID=1960083 RepID=A0A8H9H9D8_9ACTO|nr:hypothetical protein GCM10011612_13310 [Actinomyces gaoshouyii]
MSLSGGDNSDLIVTAEVGGFYSWDGVVHYVSPLGESIPVSLTFSYGGRTGELSFEPVNSTSLKITGVKSIDMIYSVNSSGLGGPGVSTAQATRSCWAAYIAMVGAGIISVSNPMSFAAFVSLIASGAITGVECWP